MDAILVKNLSVYYGKRCALWDMNFSLSKGKITGILGPNGAGKTTLLKALLGFLPLASGEVRKENFSIAYVPQKKEIDLDFPISAIEVVLMGAYQRLSWLKWSSSKEKERALSILAQLKMQGYEHRQIGELSGGQLQRVIVARALMQDADFYILDEPFTGVDFTTESDLMELFRSLAKENKGIVLVHHDLSTVTAYFDELLLVSSSLIAGGKTEEVYTSENIKKTYGERVSLLEEAGMLMQKSDAGEKS